MTTRLSTDFKPVAAEPDTYKFRGKRISDGLWVSGCLVWIKDGAKWTAYIYGYGAVHPASIGQFTGVYDKNGDEIYEGDILEYDGAEIPEEERSVVVYVASEGSFKLKNPRYDYMDDLNSLTASMEIIVGNTYDGIYGERLEGERECR